MVASGNPTNLMQIAASRFLIPLMSPPKNLWITHRSRSVYENPWIQVTESEVTNPGGGPGTYGMVHFKNRAIGIVPIDEKGFTWLVGQSRYTLNSYEWEIPAGGCPAGESPLDAAGRELTEETGLIAGRWRVLLDEIALSNSVTDERATIYVACDLTPGEASPDETEDLAIRRLPLSEAIAMVHRGEITDAISVIALLALAAEGTSSLSQR